MKQTVKSQVLEIMETQKGSEFSGQELAEKLGVTRAAVWKAVEALREDGYLIEGTTNRGYILSMENDIVSPAIINEKLSDEAKAFYEEECFDVLSSTNTVLKERALSGAKEGLVLMAEKQTAGRGRMGRSFYSSKGSGIYLSVLLLPDLEPKDAVQITAAAAVAGAEAFEAVCMDGGLAKGAVQIKWVNDLYLDSHKICGILTEGMLSMESGKLDYAILGIGFNLSEPDGGWPEDIKDIAGGLPNGMVNADTRAKIVAAFLESFLKYYKEIAEKTYLSEYRKRQFVIGETVDVLKTGKEPRPATAIDVDESCCLVVKYIDDGSVEALNSGEVRIKPKA